MSDDRRNMYRYPVQDSHNWAVLKHGRHSINVLLIDESAGGFSIASGPLPNVEVGTKFALHTTHAGNHQVEVVHMQQAGEEVRLGVRRVRELRSEGVLPLSKSDEKQPEEDQPWWLPTRSTLVNCGVIGVALLAFGVVLSNSLVRGTSIAAAYRKLVPPQPEAAVKSNQPAALTGVQLANSLTSPSVMQKLHLSEKQKDSINRTFDETAAALTLLYKNPGERSEQQVALEANHIVERSLQRFVCMLTDSQLRQWLGLLNTRDKAPDENEQASN